VGLIVNSADFTGKHRVSTNMFSELDAYINRYETRYLIDLLGKPLFDLFVADLVMQVPQSAEYLAIYNQLDYDNLIGCECASRLNYSYGLKDMLLGFIYFDYMRDTKYKPTSTGVVANQYEVSREVSASGDNLYSRYNESVSSYRTIRNYIINNSATYPTFKGVCKDYASWCI
jgi:hypothetical protein